jgi:hypothetical protein
MTHYVSSKPYIITLATHSTSSALEDLRRRYNRTFPSVEGFPDLSFYQTLMTEIHALVDQNWHPRFIWWIDCRPLRDQELIPFASHVVEAAREEYQQTQKNRVPRWLLRFALHFLSLDSPPPLIADCLVIIAIALNHNLLDERYVCLIFMDTHCSD